MAPRRRAPRAAGQHFLRSSRLASDLVRESVGAVELAVEPGAGTGVITAALAAAFDRVWAVEVDPGLADRLRRRFAGRPRVTVIEADAATLRWPREPFVVVSNLPFAGGSAIMRSLLADPHVPLCRAHVILQWEAALKRARVWPSTVTGVYWSAWYELAVVRRLAPSAFAPAPGAAAGVLRAVRRPEPLVPVDESRAYHAFLRTAFSRSPRALTTARNWKRLSAELGFDRRAHPRNLDARQWSEVFLAVRRAR